jgi:hypothetical protein
MVPAVLAVKFAHVIVPSALSVVEPPVNVVGLIVQPPIVPDFAANTPASVTVNTELAPRDIPFAPIYTPAFASVKLVLPFPIYVLLIANPPAMLPINPLVAVIAPVIVADVAVNVPSDAT